MMFRNLILLLLLLLSPFYYAQHSDCFNALILKDSILTVNSVEGYGNKNEFSPTYSNFYIDKEEHSYWVLIKIQKPGMFTFDIFSSSKEESDWDFMLYDVSEIDNYCDKIKNHQLLPIRTNLSRSSNTGLSINAKNMFVGPGIGNPNSSAVKTKENQTFLLVIHNPKTPKQGFRLKIHLSPFAPSVSSDNKKENVLQDEQKKPASIRRLFIDVIDKQSGKKISSEISIKGLKRKTIFLNNTTHYETELMNKKYYIEVNAFAKGYMLVSKQININRKTDTTYSKVKLEPIEIGKKSNLTNINFYGDSPKILPESEDALVMLTNFLKVNNNVNIEIEGHVNGPHQRNSNDFKTLSKKRAKAIRDYLVNNGISSERITFAGYGNSQMLFPEAVTEAQKKANRRVEIRITDK
ncbi:MAG: hypothetical protein Kow0079_00900 [Vicingaceae bacterium]